MLDISYKNYRKKSDIHGTVLYPAVMVAPIQKDIIKKLFISDNINSVFDPFHGSGTSLYEAFEVSEDLDLFGCDINPLANLITKVKLSGVSNTVLEDVDKLKYNILNNKVSIDNHHFNNIEKWFRDDIIKDLSKIRHHIIKFKCKQNRLYFWYILSDIIRKYSNTRSSTYKLHIKPQESILSFKNNIINDFINSLEKNVGKFNKNCTSFSLYKCNVLDKIVDFTDNSFDLCVTSPPYGDNATTVTYGQFSSLPLLWIDKKDLELEGWELNNYSIIDSRSLGSNHMNNDLNSKNMDLISPYLNKIAKDKQVKVIKFFKDYFIFLSEVCRVTKTYIVMTLGNRTVSGINIDLTDITRRYLDNNNFSNIDTLSRDIPNKRMPKTTSRVSDKPVSSINKEYVLIHKKLLN